ncbi:MFS transporter [Elioraea rosea]|uniref:MFS transporter n=1 Tax=Elioraea rosea TaxID=2492390 RepID=UPI001181D0D1|nr:MFS transporter [Elioraea rosea]
MSGIAHQRRNVGLLFLCQSLNQAAMSGQVAMSALIGHSLAGDKALATLPMAVQMAATMAASIPASWMFARLGRRIGFSAGATSHLVSLALAVIALWQASFGLYLLSTAFGGLAFGIAMHYRFAAAEAADASWRPKAISLVMAGGVFGAWAGPEIVKWTKEGLAPVLFAGSYVAFSVIPATALVVLAMTRLPAPPPRPAVAVPLGPILRRPQVLVAIIAAVIAWDTMNLVMAATPLEMMLCGFGVNDSATIIQWHAAAMFAPAFVTGHLISRFGVGRVIGTGAMLTAACAAIAIQGSAFGYFLAALVLLGIGWNFMFVGATTLLSASLAPAERYRGQAANDMIVFGSVTFTAVGAGVVHHHVGWLVLNLAILPAVGVALLALAWLPRREEVPAPG